jgi:hypothetical protein
MCEVKRLDFSNNPDSIHPEIIKVETIAEEYRFIADNPHLCELGVSGTWQIFGQALTFDCHDVLTAQCSHCHHVRLFEFDISSKFSKSLQDEMKKLKGELHGS